MMRHLILVLAAIASVSCTKETTIPIEASTADVGIGIDDADAAPSTDTQIEPRSNGTVPLEVLGLPPYSIDVSVSLDSVSDAELVLTLQNVVASNAMTVAINGSEPLDLAEPSLGFLTDDGSTREGTIMLAAASLREGENVFTFSYTTQIDDISGFRVLAFELRSADEIVQLDSHPQTFVSDAADIENGRRLFVDEALDGGPTCATCHVDSGVDLKYFGFSKQSIVARAMLHEVPEQDAIDVANYIYQLPTEVIGSPFDPPFQPGPENELSKGAGYRAVLPSDAAFGELVFGSETDQFAWDHAATFDLYRIPVPVELPNWFRWLPRKIDETWFTMRDDALQIALDAFRDDPTSATGQSFMNVVVETGKQLVSNSEDHLGRIELLRFAAIKLWEQSRTSGFDRADYGFESLGPHYPYEVGFAFFEAAQDGFLGHVGWRESRRWWWAQIVVNAGRGQSTLERPLNYADVLDAFDRAGAGSNEMLFIYLLGSYEDSLGERGNRFGTGEGPERLLPLALPAVPDAALFGLWMRHLEFENTQVALGTTLAAPYLQIIDEAWTQTCARLSPTERDAIHDASLNTQLQFSSCTP